MADNTPKKKKRRINYPIKDTNGKISSVTVEVDESTYDDDTTTGTLSSVQVIFNLQQGIKANELILPLTIKFDSDPNGTTPTNIYLNESNVDTYSAYTYYYPKNAGNPNYTGVAANFTYTPKITEPEESDGATIKWTSGGNEVSSSKSVTIEDND